jgi:NitT/TauT family transport system substrate-binding protein
MSELHLNRRKFLQYGSLTLGTGVLAACGNGTTSNTSTTTSPSPGATASPTTSPAALDRITFGTNWYAQAEHGGFYQAVAKGIYKDHGLEVTIKMGGPQVNGTQLLMGGAIDFFMGYGAEAIRAVEEGIPKITVASMFQKDPQIILVHPDQGVKTLEDLKGKPILVSAAANSTFWPWLKAKYGFTDDQKRPYNFTMGPFLADKTVAQQGYLSSEPLKIRKEGGFDPLVILLADQGWTPYSTTIETRKEIVDTKSDLVQRFVDASIKGWYSYFEDPAPGNGLIKKDNPEMSDDQLAYGISKMKEYGIVISGDAETKGIGTMNEARWKEFFDSMAAAGVFKTTTNYKDAFTLNFVNKGVDYYKKA